MCYAVDLGAGRKPMRRREFITLVSGAAVVPAGSDVAHFTAPQQKGGIAEITAM
jgi:hypothetical protein